MVYDRDFKRRVSVQAPVGQSGKLISQSSTFLPIFVFFHSEQDISKIISIVNRLLSISQHAS